MWLQTWIKIHVKHFHTPWQPQPSFTFIPLETVASACSPTFISTSYRWKKWGHAALSSYNLGLIVVCFCNGDVEWVDHYRSRYMCSQWLKQQRNTPSVWMASTWIDTVFAVIYFSAWRTYYQHQFWYFGVFAFSNKVPFQSNVKKTFKILF